MLFQCVVVTGSAADEDGSVKVINTTLKYINSHYEDLVDFDALLGKNDTATGWNLEELPVYSNCDEAVEAIRNSMIHREPDIALAVDVSDLNLAFPDEGAADYEETSAALNNFLYETFMSRPLEHGSVPNGGDYLAFTMVYTPEISMSSDSTWEYVERIELRAAPAYYTTAEQEAAVDAEVARLVEGWKKMGLGDCSTEEGQYAAASAIYSFICDHVVYDHEGLEDENDFTKYSAYAALIEGTSVCQGYANLFYRLALEMGLDARIIGGIGITSTGSGPHAWNIVGLGDKYYNLDATWDAEWYENGLCYEHYLTSASFDQDHIRDAEYMAEGFTSAYPMAEADYFTYTTANGEIDSEFTAEEPGYELAYLKDLVSEDELSAAFGESYPGSVNGFPAVEHVTLLEGDVITGVVDGKHCWGEEGNNALMAFDGDPETFFDPVEPSTDYFCGVDLGEGNAYQLTEVRILPRNEWADRIVGGAVQGSNDGKSWTSIVHVDGVENAPAGLNYHCITPYAVYSEEYAELGYENLDLRGYWVGEGSYRYYRYVNLNGQHGNVAEIELYGMKADATVKEDDPAVIAWQLENGNLTISGEGAVVYDNPADLPWYQYRNCIQRVNVGYGITEIGEKMFAGYPLLHSISIPGSVKNIGTEAFAGCNSLMNLNLNLGIKALMGNAFTASAVRWAKIPATIETYNWAFSAAPFLEGIELYGEGFAFGTMDEDMLVSSDEKVFFHYPAGRRDTSFTVPSGIETLATHSIDQTGLEELNLPFSLKNVWAYAVTENNGLTVLTIPASVSVIDVGAFAYNSALKEVYFYGDYYDEFSDDLFDGAAEDLIVYYPDGNDTWDACNWPYTRMPFDAGVLADGTVDGISWVITADGTLTFSGEGAIPDYHGFWEGDQPEWFSLQETVNTVVIEEGITDVGAHALRNFDNVTEIRMPDSLKRIGSFAFAECGSLTELNITAGVEWIETGISWNSQNLSAFHVDEGNEWYNDIDGVLFSESGADLIAYPLGRTDDTYEIPSTVRSIGTAAFENEWDLTSVVLNEGLQFIRDSAFCGIKLTELVIPMTVKHIEGWAFNTGGSLTSAVFEGAFPDHFGEYVFYGNEENPSENMPGEFKITANKNMPGWDQFTEGVLNAENNPEYPLELIDEPVENYGAGQMDNGMSWYIDPDGTLYVNGNGASEMSWYDGEGENEVPWKKYARYITAIEISEGIIDVSGGAFADLYNAVSVKLPETMQWIHDGAFHNCGSLEEVYIPARVEHIEGNAFNWCSGVQRYIVDEANECYYSDEDGVLYGDGGSWLMFYPVGRTDITEYTVDGSVYSVNGGAFARSSLRAVTFNDGVAVIGHSAFAESGNLEEVLFGSTVAGLNNDAFADCPSLVKATFEGPAPAGEIWNLFTEVPDEFKVYYPENAGWEIDENGMWWTNEEQCYPTEAYSVGNPVIYSGEFDGFAWTLTNAGVLTVSGEGELPQFHDDVDNGGFGSEAPWHHVRGLVRTAVVEDGITALGHRTFADMDFLQDLQLPGTLEKLYSGAVHNSALSELHLPASLKEIENGAFDSLWNLNTVAADGCEAYQVVDGVLYNADMTELVLYPCRMEDEDSEFTVPGTVSAIHPSAFKHTELESITLSDNLEYIGWWAFAHNYSLTEIHIPARVTYIASCAFYDCRNLKDAWFYGMAPTVENEIFNETHEEFTVHYPTNLSGWILNEEGKWQPDGNPPYNAEGHEVEVPEGAVEVGELIVDDAVTGGWSFEWDGTLTFWGSGSMPGWDYGAESPWYKYAPAVTRVVFAKENALTSIGRHTFRDCVSLTSVEIPGNIEIIEDEAFAGCRNLTEIRLNEGLREIRHAAFHDACPEVIEIPASLEFVDHGAFKFCYVGAFSVSSDSEWFFNGPDGELYRWENDAKDNISLVAYPVGREDDDGRYDVTDGIREIYNHAFSGSTLKVITLPDDLPWINSWTFEWCEQLEEVHLPLALAGISDNAFHGCTNLQKLYFRSAPPAEIWHDAFAEVPESLTVYYPSSIGGWDEVIENGQWTCSTPEDENGYSQSWTFNAEPYDAELPEYVAQDVVTVEDIYDEDGNLVEASHDITWYITWEGELHFKGNGSMPGWDWDENPSPWYSYCNYVESVTFEGNLTTLARQTLRGCTKLTSVEIPGTVRIIEHEAIVECPNLTSIQLNEGLEEIWHCVFRDMEYIDRITIPSTVYYVEGGAFNALNVGSYEVADGNEWFFTDEDGVLYGYENEEKNRVVLVAYPIANGYEEYTVEDSVIGIDNWSFAGSSLKQVNIPDSVEWIGCRAFENNENLTEVTLPMSLNNLGDHAFCGCRSLENVYARSAFDFDLWHGIFEETAENLTIHYPSANPWWNENVYEDDEGNLKWSYCTPDEEDRECYTYNAAPYEFEGNIAEGTVTVDDEWDEEGNATASHNITWYITADGILHFEGEGSMPDWDWESFAPWYDYRNIVYGVEFGEKLTTVGRQTLRDIDHITSVTVPGNIELIQAEAIVDCHNLNAFMIEDGVMAIREGALSCFHANIDEIVIPMSVGDISWNAFGDTRVGRFTIEQPGEYFTDEQGVLYYWTDEEHTRFTLHSFPIGSDLEEYTILDKTCEIASQAFRWATSLKKITIPDTVEYIAWWAFSECDSLEEIVLPASLNNLDGNAFYSCDNLNAAYFRSVPPDTVWSEVFHECAEGFTVYYPDRYSEWNDAVSAGKWIYTIPEDENGDTYTFEYPAASYTMTGIIDSGFVTVLDEWDDEGNQYEFKHDINWYVTAEGELHILGEGTMPNYGSEYRAPWFRYNEFVTRIVVEDGITRVGSYSFADFVSVTEIDLADSVENLYPYAFRFCSSLETAEIPKNVTGIWYAFDGSGVKNFSVDEENWVYFAEDGVLFEYETAWYEDGMDLTDAELRDYQDGQAVIYKNRWILSQYPTGRTDESYTVPENTYAIGVIAFEFEQDLKEIILNDGLETIGQGAFWECYGLESITIPASVTEIYCNAFNHCGALKTVTFEGDLPQFYDGDHFAYCPDDMVIRYPDAFAASYAEVIDEDGYWSFVCSKEDGEEGETITFRYLTESYTISGNRAEGTVTVDDRCDEEGNLIEAAHDITWYITWNGELHVLGEGSTADWDWEYPAPWYKYREYVNKVVVHDGITRIGGMNFVHLDCDVELSETVIELAYGAFTDCGDLGTIRLSKNMAYVYGGAFSGSVMDAFDVDDANPIYFDENGVLLERNSVFAQYVEEQPEGSVEAEINGEKVYVFHDIWLLTAYPSGRDGESYTVPSNVIYIAEMAFGNSQNLKEINLNPELLYIAQHAFSGCHQITELTIPAGVREVGRNFINSCSSLKKVTFEGCAPMFTDPTVFEGCPGDMMIYYPAGFEAWDQIITYTEEDGYRWNITYVDWDSPAHDEYVVSYRAVPTESASSGKLAENLFWELTKDGVLRVWGNGAIRNYNDGFCAPWTPLLGDVAAISVEPDKNGSISIGTFAFRNCGAIESITLNEGVTQINSYAFADCVLPGGYVQKIPSTAIIEWSAFACVDINAYDAEGSANGYLTEEDGTFLYYQDEHQKVLLDAGNAVTEVWLSEGVTHIANCAFDRCTALTALMIPASIQHIGGAVFDACTSLRYVYFMGANEGIVIDTDNLFGETGSEVYVYVPKYAKESWNDFKAAQDQHGWYGNGYFIHGGDVDADLDVDADDAMLLSRYFAGLVDPDEIYLQGADVDGVYGLTRKDAMVLNRWLAGWDVEINRIIGADE